MDANEQRALIAETIKRRFRKICDPQTGRSWLLNIQDVRRKYNNAFGKHVEYTLERLASDDVRHLVLSELEDIHTPGAPEEHGTQWNLNYQRELSGLFGGPENVPPFAAVFELFMSIEHGWEIDEYWLEGYIDA